MRCGEHVITPWPKGKLIYKISKEFNTKEKNAIVAGTKMISDKTCITFRQATTSDKSYVQINKVSNKVRVCKSKGIGIKPLNQQPQVLELNEKCIESGTGHIAHEFIHALGFYHEHVRPDRDDYVTVHCDNIQEDKKCDFKIRNTNTSGSEYDYTSIMHYGYKFFAKNKDKETLTPKQSFHGEMGQREKLSDSDVKKINKMYKGYCPNS